MRFMEERAYVVTFRQTDPLYVIDLKNPADPVIAGELEIPGFSTYLRPLGPTQSELLLAVGQDVDAARTARRGQGGVVRRAGHRQSAIGRVGGLRRRVHVRAKR